MTDQELAHCKSCWDAFANLDDSESHKNTVKKAEMLVKSIGAMATYQLCGFEDKELPDQVKQIIADGLMYLEITYKNNSHKN